ncbi:MAG: Uma2 family endonuclease [Cyanobacteria bacterium P01_F01_bin.153]
MNLSQFASQKRTKSIANLPEAITLAIDKLPTHLTELAYASFDGWVEASWDDFVAISGNEEPEGLPQARGYYNDNKMHLAMVPLGYEHSRQNSAPVYVVTLYATFKNLCFVQCINASLRKSGQKECQPDLSIYIGSDKRLPSKSENKVIDLDRYDPPSLVVEISGTSLTDDLGPKKLLYQELGIQEYWVIDALKRSLIAFDLSAETAEEITQSVVLPGLDLAIVTEALRRTDENNDAAITMWLIEMFQE